MRTLSFGVAVELLNNHKYHNLIWWECRDISVPDSMQRWAEGRSTDDEDGEAIETLSAQEAIEIAEGL